MTWEIGHILVHKIVSFLLKKHWLILYRGWKGGFFAAHVGPFVFQYAWGRPFFIYYNAAKTAEICSSTIDLFIGLIYSGL